MIAAITTASPSSISRIVLSHIIRSPQYGTFGVLARTSSTIAATNAPAPDQVIPKLVEFLGC